MAKTSGSPCSASLPPGSLGAFAAPAQAAQQIEELLDHDVDLAGRRPSRPRRPLSSWRRRGSRKSPRTSPSTAPTGVFGNPSACDPVQRRSTSRLDQCPPNSQAGLITLRANYEGNPDYLLGTAPIYSVEPGRRGSRALRLHRADPGHPDRDPGHDPLRHRLRPALHRLRHHPADAARRGRLHLLGLPGAAGTTSSASPKARRAPRRAARVWPTPSCIDEPGGSSLPVAPAHRQPRRLQRRAAGDHPRRDRPTRTPRTSPTRSPPTRRSPMRPPDLQPLRPGRR